MPYPNGGFTKFPNSLRDMPWLKKPKTVTVYFWLRMHANHFPTEWCGLSLLPGELCASQERIERETGLTRAEVRTALDHLKASGCVVVKTYKLQPANQPADQPTASPAKAPTKCSIFCFTDKENWGSSEGGSTNLLTEGSTNDSTKEPATDKEVKTDNTENVSLTQINTRAPTWQEVEAYFYEKGIGGDPVMFWAHYEAVGWLLGGQPIVNWKALAFKWERNGIDER